MDWCATDGSTRSYGGGGVNIAELDLLDAVIEDMAEQPERHDQGEWRRCIAAFTTERKGLRWVSNDRMSDRYNHVWMNGRPLHVAYAAAELLGFPGENAMSEEFEPPLFHYLNTMPDIIRIRDELAAQYGLDDEPVPYRVTRHAASA